MNKRRSIMKGLLALAGISSARKAVAGDEVGQFETTAARRGGGLQLLFAYRNTTIKFTPTTQSGSTVTFTGDDLGTTEGVLSGTIIQNFIVTVNTLTGAATTGPDRALFTDLDRDQINFEYGGVGTFLPPSNLNRLMAAGGSLLVTYTVLDATGKYKPLIGRQFPARVIATNAASPSSGVLGAIYAEVYAHDVPFIKRSLNLEVGNGPQDR